jgi:hypothetical protein
MVMRIMIMILFLSLVSTGVHAQFNWELKKDEDGIKVYTSSTANSNFKSIKVECTVKATQAQFVAFLLDITKQHEWVYNTKSTQLLKTVKPNELIFYSEVNVPWPCTNRDYIAHFVINQVSPQLLTIDSHAEPGFLPVKEGLVRVEKSVAHWEVATVSGGLQIVYTLQFDPGGSVPAWLTNLFITKGPLQTFQKLKEEVSKPVYQNAHVDFIK